MNNLDQMLEEVGAELNDLVFVGRTSGRKQIVSPLAVGFERELDYADLVERLETNVGAKAQSIKKLKDSHHNLARMLASGMSNAAVSAISGYSTSRISVLKSDPAFEELMQFYRDSKEEFFADVNLRLSQAALNAVEAIQERLDESPDNLKTPELIKIAEMGLDRTGHGPQSTQNHLHGHFTPQELKAMREEADEKEKGVTVLEGRLSQEDSQTGISKVTVGEPLPKPEAERLESKGQDLRKISGSKAEEDGATR